MTKFQVRRGVNGKVQVGNPPAGGDLISRFDAVTFACALALAAGVTAQQLETHMNKLKGEADDQQREADEAAAAVPPPKGRPEKTAWKEDPADVPFTSDDASGVPLADLEDFPPEEQRARTVQATRQTQTDAQRRLAEVNRKIADKKANRDRARQEAQTARELAEAEAQLAALEAEGDETL